MPHSTNGTSMLPLCKRLDSSNMRLSVPGDHGQVADGWQGTTIFSSYFVTPLAILVTLPAGSHILGMDTSLSTLVQEQSHTKEPLKRCPMVPGLRRHPKWCSFSFYCAVPYWALWSYPAQHSSFQVLLLFSLLGSPTTPDS